MISIMLALAINPDIAAHGDPPAKMLIVRGHDGVAVTDYPSISRCEAARRVALEMAQQVDARAHDRGDDASSEPIGIAALCIPG